MASNDSGEEDVLNSAVWKYLTTREKALHRQVEEGSLMVCVPTTESLGKVSVGISRALLMSHVLRPSPFFKNMYESLDESVALEISNDEVLVMKSNHTALDKAVAVPIHSEELMYPSKTCKNKKPHRLFLIAMPLTIVSRPSLMERLSAKPLAYPEVESFQNASEFFHKWPENILVLRKYNKAFESFNQTYIPVPGYESHASSKVNGLIEELMEALTITNHDFKKLYNTSPNLLAPIHRLVGAYSMGFPFEKLYTNVCLPATRSDDLLFQGLMFAHSDSLKPSELGLPDHLWIGTDKPARTLGEIPGKCSPGEKISCIRRASEQIREAVTAQNPTPSISSSTFSSSSSSSSVGGGGAVYITNDELIPLLGFCILKAKLTNAFGNAFFLEHFSFIPNRAVSQEYFYVTSFKAALEYLYSVLKGLPVSPPASQAKSGSKSADSSRGLRAPSPRKTIPISLALQKRGSPDVPKRPMSTSNLLEGYDPYSSPIFAEPATKRDPSSHIIKDVGPQPQPPQPPPPVKRSISFLSAPTSIDLFGDEYSSAGSFLVAPTKKS